MIRDPVARTARIDGNIVLLPQYRLSLKSTGELSREMEVPELVLANRYSRSRNIRRKATRHFDRRTTEQDPRIR